MPTCPNCGIENLEGIQVCGACGAQPPHSLSLTDTLRDRAGVTDETCSGPPVRRPSTKFDRRANIALALSVALLLLALAAVYAFFGSGAELSAELELETYANWWENWTLVVVLGEVHNGGISSAHATVHLEIFTGYDTEVFDVDAGKVPGKGSIMFTWAEAFKRVDSGRVSFTYWVKEYVPPVA